MIVGATIGAIAAIGAGYLAYRKWRGHGRRGVDPQIRAASIAAMNAIDPVHEDDHRMQANPVYEGTALQQAPETYEQPHIDTWARDLYSTQESESKAVATTYGAPAIPVQDQSYATLQGNAVNLGQFESAHSALRPSAWNSQFYATSNGGDMPPAYETLATPQQPWNAAQYAINVVESGQAKYYTIANPDQHQPWEEPAEFMGFPETSEL